MTSVLVLGAGFGGLELSTLLSESLGDSVQVTLIDRRDAFVFGYSKLDVMLAVRPWTRCACRTGASRSAACACSGRASSGSTRPAGG